MNSFITNTTTTTSYDESTWSPAYAVFVKPLENVSLYANYIEGSRRRAVVGADFVNAGAVFPPFQTKQKEAGVKVDFGRVTTTVAAFEITRPSLLRSACRRMLRQAPDGEQRNRGIEINTFRRADPGRPSARRRGVHRWTPDKDRQGALSTTESKAPGVADVNLNFGAEWDTPFIPRSDA